MKCFSVLALGLLAWTSSVHAAVYVFDNSNNVSWVGKKLAGKHDGVVKLKEGKLDLDAKGEKGRFVLDMKSIQNSDLSGEWKAKLEGHLKSADFFNVDKYPEALIVIKELTPDAKDKSKYVAKAELTIKDITKPITIPTVITQDKGKAKVTAKFAINRLDWDVRYNSGKFFDPKELGDKLINDEVDFEVALNSK